MNRFKKAGTILRAFSRTGDAKGLLNAELEHTDDTGAAGAEAGAEGSMLDSKHGSNSPTKEGAQVYNEESAEPVSPRKARRGGLLSALSDRKLLGGGYCADLNNQDDESSDNKDGEGNAILKAVSASADATAHRIGELPSKPSMESPSEKKSESTQMRARRSQQPAGTQRRFRKTKAKEEATVTKNDNEDLEATVAQVDGGEGGYSQLILSERGEGPVQSPGLPGPDPEVSLTAHSADIAHSTSHGDDDSATETDYEDKPSPNEKDERRGRSERTTKGTRPKDERGSSRKPQSRGSQKEQPRKPGEKRSSTATTDGSGRRRSIEHDPSKRTGSERSGTKGASERRKSNDSVDRDLDSAEHSTPTRVQKDGEETLGEESQKASSRAWPSAQKVKDSEKSGSKHGKKEGSRAWPSAQKVNSKSREKPKERELLQHLDKDKKKTERGGVKRVNSSKSLFVGSKKDQEGEGGDAIPGRGVRSGQSERSAATGSLLGQMRSSVSERNLITSSEHTPSVLGPGTSNSVFHSDHGLDLGPLGSLGSLDLGPAATDSETLAALTTLSWTTRPASPGKKSKPGAALQKDDVGNSKANLFTSAKNDNFASGTPEKTEPDESAGKPAISPDHDEAMKNKASKDGSKPRRDGKESSGPTSSSKRNESNSSKSKRDWKDEDRSPHNIKKDESSNGKHSRESRESRTRSRPEGRQRGQSVQPESRSRGTSVRAQGRKKSEPDVPATSERRKRRPSMGSSGAVFDGQGESRRNLVSSERGSEPPTATTQIDSRSNDLSTDNAPATRGPEDTGRHDSTPKAGEGEVAKELLLKRSPKKYIISPTKKSPRPGSPTKISKGLMETDALPQAPLSSSKQNGTKSPRHNTIPKSPKSPRRERRSSLGSPRRRMKGSSPTGSTPGISMELAMALTGPPNLNEGDEGDESLPLDFIRSTGVGAANSSPSDYVRSKTDIVLSDNDDEPFEDPLVEFEDWSDAADDASLLESFGSNPQHPRNAGQEQRVRETFGHTVEDWSDAADDEGVLESFGNKSANLDKGSVNSSVTAQSYSHRAQDSVGKKVEEWSDAADESTVADQEKRAQGSAVDAVSETVPEPETIEPESTIRGDFEESKQNSETNAQEEGVEESAESEAGDDVADTPNGNAAAESSVISASPKAAETMESGVDTRESIATDASTGDPLDDVADSKDEEHVEEIPKSQETNENDFLDDYEKHMKGVSLEVENEVPLLFIADIVSEKSKAVDKDDDTALATDSVDDNQATETTEDGDGENKYASSSVYALLSSELTGSKERLAETRLEVSQLEKEVDLLRLRLNALEKTLS